jgi:hypothetical protein
VKDLLWFALLVTLAAYTVLIFYTLVVTSAQKNEELVAVQSRGPVMKDFSNIYLASLMFNSGEKNVYDPSVQLAWQNKLVAPMHLDQVFGFQYPPFVFPLLIPVSWVPPALSYVLWCLFGAIFGSFGSIVLMKALGNWTARQGALLLLASTLSFPGLMSLGLGQFSWWLLGYYSLFTWCLIRSRDVLGGVILAVTAIKPHYAIFLGLPSLATKRWKMIFAAFVAGAVLIVCDGATIGWDHIATYPNVLRGDETSVTNSGVHAAYMSSLRAVFVALFPADIALKLSAIAMLAGFCLAFYIWTVAQKSETGFGNLHRWAMALTVVLGLVVSPHCHTHDLFFLALPAMLTLRQADAWKSNLYKGWFFILSTYPITSWLFCLQPIIDTVRRLPNLALMLCLLLCGGLHFINLVKENQRERKHLI